MKMLGYLLKIDQRRSTAGRDLIAEQTKQNAIIDLPRQMFGEYNFVSELKIWD